MQYPPNSSSYDEKTVKNFIEALEDPVAASFSF